MQRKRPNIVVILADDLGPWALGCAGNSEIQTPNIDRIAREGVRLENFFCVSPVCSPARASLLTGRIPSQHGVQDWIVGGNGPFDWMHLGGTGRSTEYLEGIAGYSKLLADDGYTCGLSGKWHLGATLNAQQGFGHWYAMQGAGGPYNDPGFVKNGEAVTENGYLTDLITRDAIGFIDEHAADEEPFYLSINHYAPHGPWIDKHPHEFTSPYADCAFETCPQEPAHSWQARSVGDVRGSLIGYFAAVTAMDAGIGEVLDALDARGIRDETIVVFTSDNGFNCGHHGLWGKGNASFPFNMYENSVKVPLVAAGPGIAAGRVSEELVSAYDFMPTVLEIAGVRNPEADTLPGRSFASLLRGDSGPVRDDVVVHDEYGPVRMIRTDRFKYVHRYPYGPHELYDLDVDPDERTNLVDEETHAETVVELRGRLERWFVSHVDPDLDGSKPGNYGNGQRDVLGARSTLAHRFHQRIAIDIPRISGGAQSSG